MLAICVDFALSRSVAPVAHWLLISNIPRSLHSSSFLSDESKANSPLGLLFQYSDGNSVGSWGEGVFGDNLQAVELGAIIPDFFGLIVDLVDLCVEARVVPLKFKSYWRVAVNVF